MTCGFKVALLMVGAGGSKARFNTDFSDFSE
jgi:hypothetical protein